MTKEEFVVRLNAIVDDIKRTLIAKNTDYGMGNIERYGELGILIRSQDKVSRLHQLVFAAKGEQRKVADESIKDTWLDLAGYAVLALIYKKEGEEHESGTERNT